MTLSEYLKQKDPVRTPLVYLKRHEYITGTCYTRVNGTTNQSIFIKGIPYEYVQINGYDRLRTTDSDGNAKELSCFYISPINK
jgi:hypothetical protein